MTSLYMKYSIWNGLDCRLAHTNISLFGQHRAHRWRRTQRRRKRETENGHTSTNRQKPIAHAIHCLPISKWIDGIQNRFTFYIYCAVARTSIVGAVARSVVLFLLNFAPLRSAKRHHRCLHFKIQCTLQGTPTVRGIESLLSACWAAFEHRHQEVCRSFVI